jgi:hypothetical protein
MRAMTIAIPASILLNIAAVAQDQGRQPSGRMTPAPPASAGTAGPQAPVGHRQPTERTLPPALRKEEDSARREPDPLGPLPSICKNC